MRAPFQKTLVLAFVMGSFLAFAAPGFAMMDDDAQPAPPAERSVLENPKRQTPAPKEDDENGGLPINIRLDAVKEAAMSYGARGGLAHRTYEIRKQLEAHASYMDKIYDFRRLLIPAPSGLLIEPPVISEDENALIINATGQEAAVADRIYNINKKAKIVSSPRLWRNYMERDWGDVTPPPDILLPENKTEREAWVQGVQAGWEKGVEQADEIYQDDLNQLTADYKGMVQYRMLLVQGMVSPPYAMQVDRGVTGGGDAMRVGDRAIQITGVPELQPESDQWQPANR